MIALENSPRDHALLRLLYLGGLRRSEARILTGRDLTLKGDSGAITVFGKGDKTRFVLLSGDLWTELLALRQEDLDTPLFRSREGGGMLDEASVWRVIKRAAKRAGLIKEVSTHWLRHSHATHAIERGAPIQLVAATLGHSDIKTTGKYLHARPSDSSSMYLAG